MKRNVFKVLIALALASIITAGSAAVVFGIQSGTIMGENNVANMIISVIVPTNFNFTLDPLEMGADSVSQVSYTNYFFINKTGAAVKVSLNVIASANNETTFVDDRSLLSKDDITATDKLIYFALLGADVLDAGDLSYHNVSEHNAKGIYDAFADTMVPFDSFNHKAAVEFILAPAVESYPGNGIDTLADGNRGIFAFQFYGELNTYAPWVSQDITVSGTYTITPLRTSTYENYLFNNAFTERGWGTQLKAGYGVQ